MNKIIIILGAFIVGLIATHLSNEYFEDKIYNENTKILGKFTENRFFLPFPKSYQLISSESDQRNTKIILETNISKKEISEFYKEILRSKDYEKDFEFEKDNTIELRYLKDSEDLKITITQDQGNSLIEFNYYN